LPGVVGGARFCQPDDGRFGGSVGMRGKKLRRRRKGQHRGHVENASAGLLRLELPHGGAIRIEQRVEIEPQRLAPTVVADLAERAVAELAAAAAGYVIEGVE